MADVKWIKIATNMFDNRKIKMLETMPEGDTLIVIWFKLLSLAGTVNDNGLVYFTKDLPFTSQMLAAVFNRPQTTVDLALKTFTQFGMVEIVEDIIHVSNWEKYQNADGLDRIREQNRLRQQKRREKLRLECKENNATVTECHVTDNVTSNVTVTGSHEDNNVTVTRGHAADIDIDIDKDININLDSDIDIDIDINKQNCHVTENKKPCHVTDININYQIIKDQWNELVNYGIKPIRILGPNTQAAGNLKKCLEKWGPESFAKVVEEIKSSDYLLGKTAESNGVTFEWAFKLHNYSGIYQGNYRNYDKLRKKVRNSCPEPERTSEDFEELEQQLLDN